MRLYNRINAIKRINQLAGKGVPFVFLINFEHNCSYIEETNAIDTDELLYQFGTKTNYQHTNTTVKSHPIVWSPSPIPFEEYQKAFHQVKNNILKGNSFLANLTCITPVESNLSLDDIFIHSEATYKIRLANHFVCFSPETFIKINNGIISSYPMKGTIRADLPRAAEQLLEDEKEMAEHATITDLIRNDLSMVAHNVSVTRYRYIDKLTTNSGKILQTSTEITGRLPDNYHQNLGNILFKLLPAGSITGAPKKKTTEIIKEAENYDRGFYTGIAGYFDGFSLDSTVMIRFVELQNGKLYFKSGGGITCQSNAISEYQEMIQKIYVPIY